MRAAVKLVTATFRLYTEAGRQSALAFTRSAGAVAVLLLAFPVLLIAGFLLSPLGLAGGILVALLADACAGTYLACLQDALGGRRSVGLAAVRANLGRYTWDIVSVQFPLGILHLLLAQLPLPWLVPFAIDLAIFVFFNPIPEMMGRSRNSGIPVYGEALGFMSRAGVEWLIPQAVACGALVLVAGASTPMLFGPGFGFIAAGGEAVARVGAGPAGWALGLGTLAGIHLLMLFRGALYVRLSEGGRRARAWAENFR
jgi:hypothetical protein